MNFLFIKAITYLFLINWFFLKLLLAEPIIVLEYATSKSSDDKLSGSSFSDSENYSTYHRVSKDESLSKIIDKYYANNNLNLKVVQTAVVHKNKHAFVRNNPNFMFANKKLYLPSISEIKNLVYKNSKSNIKKKDEFQKAKDIYFFGN